MEKQNTQELRSVSDGQKNTLDKDQSKIIDAELVGLLEMDENTGWGTTERYSEKTQPNPQTNSHYKSFLNELIRKSAERKSVQNSANGLENDNILGSGNSQSVMINKSLYHLNGRAGIITNVTPETRHNIDKTTGSDTNIASPVSQTSYNINR